LATNISEPPRIYWAIGIVASIVLHAGGVASAVLLTERLVRDAAPTEITFSHQASPMATPVPAQAALASKSGAAPTADRERLTPVAAETTTASAPATLQPVETSAASAPQTAQPLRPKVSPQTIQPTGSLETALKGQPEKATALTNGTLATLKSSELLSSSSPASVSALSSETADRIVAVDQRAGTVLAPALGGQKPSAPSAEIPQVGDAVTPLPASQSVTKPTVRLKQEALQPQDSPTEMASALSVQPEIAKQVEPSVQPAMRLEPELLRPSVKRSSSELEPITVLPAESPIAAPVDGPVETALLVPARPGSILGTAVDKPSDRYRRIVDFIRRYSGGDCFIALPAMSLYGAVTFQTFGRDKVREDSFRQAVFDFDGLRAEISSGDVADPQCQALAFARSAKRYPGFSLMIDLDEADVASGTRLSGSVLNANGRDVYLLMVDDEGRVQSADRFLAAGDGLDRPFDTPLVLTGGPVTTKQILLAIAVEPPVPALAAPVDELTNTFFARLGREIDAAGADVDLAVEGFSVR
jgi:hypothetical protein